MKREYGFTRRSRREYDNAIDWYRSESPPAASRFILKFDKLMDRIAEHPEWFATAWDDIRQATLYPPFPYSGYFRVETDRIVIASVFHNFRDPESLTDL